MIRLDDAARRYGATWALRGVTLEVPPGETHALVGPNGAGKTTALRLLATLESPTSGAASVDGHRTRDDPSAVRRRVGYLGHDPPAYEALTPREHLIFDARARASEPTTGRSGAGRRGDGAREPTDAAVDALLADLDLPPDVPAGRLSRGTLRRLGLARALVADPPALLLDEPFATLDPAARRDAVALVADPAPPRAVLLAAHDLEAAAEAATALHVLRDGRLEATLPAHDPARARQAARARLEGPP